MAPGAAGRQLKPTSSISTTVLDDGLTIVTERMEHVRSVAVGFWAGVGSRDETDEQSGASHFLEHLLFKGTDTRAAAQIAEAVDEVGGDLNAFTTKEYTAFEVRLLADHLDVGLDVLSDIFWYPAFRPDDVDIERDVILEEILAAADEHADLVHDHLIAAMFPGQALGRSILGTEESIETMERDAIAAFHDAHYRPARVIVAAAGALDHAAFVDAISARRCSRVGHPPELTRVPLTSASGARASDERESEQVHLAMGLPGLPRAHPDRYALDVLVHVLGGGLSSRLFQEVREQRGLAYDVYASRAAYEGAGVVSLYAATAPRNAQAVEDVFRSQLDALARDGISARELEVAKGNIRASMLLGLEDSGARMARLARLQITLGSVPTLDEVLARYEALALDDIGAVATKLLTCEPALALVGPRGTAR